MNAMNQYAPGIPYCPEHKPKSKHKPKRNEWYEAFKKKVYHDEAKCSLCVHLFTGQCDVCRFVWNGATE